MNTHIESSNEECVVRVKEPRLIDPKLGEFAAQAFGAHGKRNRSLRTCRALNIGSILTRDSGVFVDHELV
jgi:hypothetical protein